MPLHMQYLHFVAILFWYVTPVCSICAVGNSEAFDENIHISVFPSLQNETRYHPLGPQIYLQRLILHETLQVRDHPARSAGQ